MRHCLRIDLLDMPQVRGVVRTIELVGGALAPPVVSKLEASKEVLASKDRMLLVPDNGLREVQSAGLEDRRVVAEVAVASPNEECPAWQQHPGDVPEPAPKHAVEFLVAHEVVG